MRRYFVAALLLALLPISLAFSQVSQLVESIEVRVTNVDVVVTDKAGNPVRGLTRDDFQIFENGKLQPVTNFYEVRAAQPATTASDAATSTPEAAATEAPPEVRKRRIIFFIDNSSLHPLRRNEVFAAIEKYMDTLFQPGDQAMLVTWNRGLRVVVPFTDDRGRLLDGVRKTARVSGGGVQLEMDKSRLKQAIMNVQQQARESGRRNRSSREQEANEAFQQALSITRAYADEVHRDELNLLSAMSTMITTLAGLEGKKVMVFAGSQLPDRPGFDMFQWVEQAFAGDIQNVAAVAYRESGRLSTKNDMEKVAQQANANNVTMYMIDGADPTRGATSSADSSEQLNPMIDFAEFTNTANSFGTIARMTGGIALMRTNNFDLALNTVARDLGSYYSLGYKPGDDTPGNRKIVVKTKNPAYTVRARTTYIVKTAEEQTKDRVISNAFHAQLKGDIPVTLFSSQPVKLSSSRYKVPLRISFPSSLTLLPNGDNLEGQFSVVFAVVDDDGALSPVSRRTQPVKLAKTAEAALRAKPIAFTAEIVVTPGEHYVSVGIVDDVSGSTGFARTRIAAR
jgi:VWFA-related protein